MEIVMYNDGSLKIRNKTNEFIFVTQLNQHTRES